MTIGLALGGVPPSGPPMFFFSVRWAVGIDLKRPCSLHTFAGFRAAAPLLFFGTAGGQNGSKLVGIGQVTPPITLPTPLPLGSPLPVRTPIGRGSSGVKWEDGVTYVSQINGTARCSRY